MKFVTVEYNPDLDEDNPEGRKRKAASSDGAASKKSTTGKGIAGHGANNKRKPVEGDGKGGTVKKAKLEGCLLLTHSLVILLIALL